MATLVRQANFVAQPGFGIISEGTRTLTIGLEQSAATNNGIYDWANIKDDKTVYGLRGNHINLISPQMSFPVNSVTGAPTQQNLNDYELATFVRENPMHIVKLNVRSISGALPSQIVILTPNIATGTIDKQIIDVTANKSAYQQQTDIITIDGLDIYLSRESYLQLLSVPAASNIQLDVTYDNYISLEKGLATFMSGTIIPGGVLDYSSDNSFAGAQVTGSVVNGISNLNTATSKQIANPNVSIGSTPSILQRQQQAYQELIAAGVPASVASIRARQGIVGGTIKLPIR
jgi:hypothetical protein